MSELRFIGVEGLQHSDQFAREASDPRLERYLDFASRTQYRNWVLDWQDRYWILGEEQRRIREELRVNGTKAWAAGLQARRARNTRSARALLWLRAEGKRRSWAQKLSALHEEAMLEDEERSGAVALSPPARVLVAV